MGAWCSTCGDEFSPVEYAPAPQDPDEPRFCSDECENLYAAAEDAAEAYEASGYPAPVFGP
jgi:hypothetical protein